MKQTIEEAAMNLANYESNNLDKLPFKVKNVVDYDNGLTRGFKAGAEWQAKQSPWISVKDRLPEESGWVFVAGGRYGYRDLFYCKGKFYSDFSLGTYDSSVTHWMPIPWLEDFNDILDANKDVLKRIKENGD